MERRSRRAIEPSYLTIFMDTNNWSKYYKIRVNYGIEMPRYNQEVLVNNNVRLRAKLGSLVNLRGISKAEIKVTLEIKDNKKPALDATLVFLYHFDD